MAVAQQGDTVRVHYKGTLNDGTQFDSSAGREPLEFKVGAGQMIQGFDKAVAGMEVGASKNVQIPADEAYGQKRDELVGKIPRNHLPEEPEMGMMLQMQTQDGQQVPVKITGISDAELIIDANHELAGQDLNFEIELVEIV